MANLEIYKFDHVVSFFNLFHIEHNFTKKQLIIINVGFDYLRCQRMSSSVKERSENSQRQLWSEVSFIRYFHRSALEKRSCGDEELPHTAFGFLPLLSLLGCSRTR